MGNTIGINDNSHSMSPDWKRDASNASDPTKKSYGRNSPTTAAPFGLVVWNCNIAVVASDPHSISGSEQQYLKAILTLTHTCDIGHDPPFGHFEYFEQIRSNWAQTLYMHCSIYSYDNGQTLSLVCHANDELFDGLPVLSLISSLFWTVTCCDRSRGGSWSMCGSVLVLEICRGISKFWVLWWSIMTCQNWLWPTTIAAIMAKYYNPYHIAIYPYMTDLKITWSWYNIPNVLQGFSKITTGHNVLQ